MSNAILGLSIFGHDTSACIVDSDTLQVLYAVAEERLTNFKHSSRFPVGSIQRCVDYARRLNYQITDVAINFDEVEFIDGTLAQEIESIIEDRKAATDLIDLLRRTYVESDFYLDTGSQSRPVIDKELDKYNLEEPLLSLIKKRIFWYYNWAVQHNRICSLVKQLFPSLPLHRVKHHFCHAATAYYNSGFENATVLTIDGQGESETVAFFSATPQGIRQINASAWPHSLGIFYLNATTYLGYAHGDEYKVMGMAAYGRPTYYELIREMVSVSENDKLIFSPTKYLIKAEHDKFHGYFYYNFSTAFETIVSRRRKSAPILQKHFDLAASVQKVTEEVGVELAQRAISRTGFRKLALAGGVALNGLMNEQIRLKSGCDEIFIFPAAGDDGTAVGAALYVAAQRRTKIKTEQISNVFYGYAADESEIRQTIEKCKLVYERPHSIHAKIAEAIAENKIVARYIGRAEFGPRALGNRSILANPTQFSMKSILNLKIKHRESFRPFAPACLAEYAGEYFRLDVPSPFMLLITQATSRAKEETPAVVHNDDTCRVQTVSLTENSDFYQIIDHFRKITGIPILINTSFNINDETIVDTPLDAVESFGHMDIDYLAIGDFWIDKQQNVDNFVNYSDAEFLQIRRARFSASFDSPLSALDAHRNYFLEKSIPDWASWEVAPLSH
jgi:carbamoyltransferase